jgi:hypothetical protein
MRYHREFFLKSSIPAFAVGILGTVCATVLVGRDGLVAGIFATLLVFFFFIVHLLVSLLAPRVSPIATMALALTSYFVKIGGLIAALYFLNPIEMNRQAFGVIAIAATTAWLTGEIRAFTTAWPKK